MKKIILSLTLVGSVVLSTISTSGSKDNGNSIFEEVESSVLTVLTLHNGTSIDKKESVSITNPKDFNTVTKINYLIVNDTVVTSSFTDTRDGKIYKTIIVGNKEWMVDNLQFAPNAGNFWAYNNDTSNISIYGSLYDWETAKTVAPSGWHLPDNSEWTELLNFFTTNSLDYNSDFFAQYGGYNDNSYFKSVDTFGMWWSKNEKSVENASVFYLSFDYNGMGDAGYGKTLGLSVRCVKD